MDAVVQAGHRQPSRSDVSVAAQRNEGTGELRVERAGVEAIIAHTPLPALPTAAIRRQLLTPACWLKLSTQVATPLCAIL